MIKPPGPKHLLQCMQCFQHGAARCHENLISMFAGVAGSRGRGKSKPLLPHYPPHAPSRVLRHLPLPAKAKMTNVPTGLCNIMARAISKGGGLEKACYIWAFGMCVKGPVVVLESIFAHLYCDASCTTVSCALSWRTMSSIRSTSVPNPAW